MLKTTITVLKFTGILVSLLVLVMWVQGNTSHNALGAKATIPVLIFLLLGFWVGFYWKDKTLQSFKRKWVWEQLSKREKTVAEQLLNADSNKEICEALFIEMNTLKTHIRNIYKKAGCGNRKEFQALFQQ